MSVLRVRRLLLVVALTALLVNVGYASLPLTPAEKLAYEKGWDKGVVIVYYSPASQYGTGFWIAPGYLVTAAHVVRDSYAGYGEVVIYKGSWRCNARVVALLPSSQGDIAILETEGHKMNPGAHIFPLLRITSETLEKLKGKPVYVLGFPFELVSMYAYDLARASMEPRVARGTFAWYGESRELLEFAALTDAGNSGGPVVDEDGRVVGAVSYAIVGEVGIMYFATSSNKIIELAQRVGIPVQLASPCEGSGNANTTSTLVKVDKRVIAYGVGAGFALALLLAVIAQRKRR